MVSYATHAGSSPALATISEPREIKGTVASWTLGVQASLANPAKALTKKVSRVGSDSTLTI